MSKSYHLVNEFHIFTFLLLKSFLQYNKHAQEIFTPRMMMVASTRVSLHLTNDTHFPISI